MCRRGVLLDDYTLATMSKVCHEIGDLNAGKLIHGKSLKTGFVLDVIVANSLMSMYSKCGGFGEWDRNFDKEVSGFVKDMQIEGLKPDAFTVSSLLTLCNGHMGKRDHGRELHGFIVRIELAVGSGTEVHLGCCLIDMYSRSNRVNVGRRVFDRMECRNVYAWTAMINGYVQNGALEEGLVLFHEMQVRDGVEPNKVSLVSVLPACSAVAGLTGVKQIHGYAIRKQFNNDVSLCNALIDMFLVQLEPENPSNYVSLSNLHASSRRWDVVSEVRTMMKDRAPGLLEVKTKVVLPNQQAPIITGEIGIKVQSMLYYFNAYYLTNFHLLKFELFIVDVDVDIVHDKRILSVTGSSSMAEAEPISTQKPSMIKMAHPNASSTCLPACSPSLKLPDELDAQQI
ncbi:hypothetical protein D5086_019470 [Populus alba]|uniref:Uncharacterized protein n=1 Tax=Populus alba TaxID=43335 RepID=A0ACC4BI13_POPAL